jgi:hypothetical protein
MTSAAAPGPAVDVAEVTLRGEAIPDSLLEFRDVGEALLGCARPDEMRVRPNFEYATRTGAQRSAVISSLNVDSSSWAIQLARRPQRH